MHEFKPDEATHYSPSMKSYFHFDNGCFIYTDNHDWIEYTASGHIKDLVEIDS